MACRDTASASEVQVFSLPQGPLGSQIHGTRQLSALLPPDMVHLELDLCGLSSFLFPHCPFPFLQRVLSSQVQLRGTTLESLQGGNDTVFLARG